MRTKCKLFLFILFVPLSVALAQNENEEEQIDEEYIEVEFQSNDNDLDGVLNEVDKCPEIEGVAENNGCPPIKIEETRIIEEAFSNLEFETGEDLIKSSSFRYLDELSNLLKQHPNDWKLKLVGHTDNQGKPENNLKLSERRAKAVMNYISSKGVNRENIQVEWFGQTKPIASNKTEEGRKRNRRVNMTVIKIQ